MRKVTELESLAALEVVAPGGMLTYSDTPIVIWPQRQAGNDDICEDPAISGEEVEPWVRHALALNGLGHFVAVGSGTPARPTSHELYHDARAHRSSVLGEIIRGAIRAAGAIARRAYARHRQRRQARAICNTLRQLDDHTLRDIGFDRSEITSVAAEMTGAAECTRVRTLPASHGLPRWDALD